MSVPFRLYVESGPQAGQRFTVEGAGATIGRQDGNTIVVDDSRLSRQHARFDLRDGALVITDLGSANGTAVNGARIAGSQVLRPGDRVQLGQSTLRVEGPAAMAPGVGDATIVDAPSGTDSTVVAGAPPGHAVPTRPLPGLGQAPGWQQPADAPVVVGGPPSSPGYGAVPPPVTPAYMAPPPPRPAPQPAANSRLPLIIGGVLAALLLLLVCGGIGVYALTRPDTNATATANAGGTATAVTVAGATTTAQVALAATGTSQAVAVVATGTAQAAAAAATGTANAIASATANAPTRTPVPTPTATRPAPTATTARAVPTATRPAATAPAGRTVTISPPSGPAGTTFTFIGTGYQGVSTVQIALKNPEGKFLNQDFQVTASGGFLVTYDSTGDTPGVYTVNVIVGQNLAATSTFTVTR